MYPSWLAIKISKSAWLVLLPDRNSRYTIQRIYCQTALEKSKESPVKNNLNVRSNQHYGFWLKNKHFNLILLSSDAWLNVTLHKKWSYPLKISSVNVTNPFTEEILYWKLHFLCSVTEWWMPPRPKFAGH